MRVVRHNGLVDLRGFVTLEYLLLYSLPIGLHSLDKGANIHLRSDKSYASLVCLDIEL